MINVINKVHNPTKTIDSKGKFNTVKNKGTTNTNNVYNYKDFDYSFLSLDRLIDELIKSSVSGYSIGGAFGKNLHFTSPEVHKDYPDKEALKFSKAFFEIIDRLAQKAYEKKSLGDLTFDEYRHYFYDKVVDILVEAQKTIDEYVNVLSKPKYDERALRNSADEYFMKELDKREVQNLKQESTVNMDVVIRDMTKFRILNDEYCRGIINELRGLI